MTKEREFTGRHMLMIILGFFGVIITVNLALATFAVRTWTGLVVDNSYVASQNFDDKLEEAERQKRLGWNSTLTQSDGELRFTLVDREGKPVTGMKVVAHVGRPANEANDRRIALRPAGDAYTAEAKLAAGQWRAMVDVEDISERHYRQFFRLSVSPEQ